MNIIGGDFGQNVPASIARTMGGVPRSIVTASRTIPVSQLASVQPLQTTQEVSMAGAAIGMVLAGGFGAMLGGVRNQSLFLVRLHDGRQFLAAGSLRECHELIGAMMTPRRSGGGCPHVLHAILTMLTCGLWLPVWVIHALLAR